MKRKADYHRLFMVAGIIEALANDLIYYANDFLNHNNKLLPNPKRNGGYLVVMDAKNGEIILLMAIGSFSTQKTEKYLNYAIGKAQQLFRHRNEHRLSFQSALTEKFTQGAIQIGDYIWSFSGHLSGVDEAISAVLGCKFSFSSIHESLQKKETQRLEVALDNVSRNEIYPFLKASVKYQGEEPGY